MDLTTIETQLIDSMCPVGKQYSIGERIKYLGTGNEYGTTDGGHVIMQVNTAPTSCTTASAATDFTGPHGLAYCTASGYYTLAQPIPGCHLTWFYFGATSQFIRARQSGTGATGPSFTYATGSTYMVINTTIQSGMSLEFYGLSSEVWLVGSHTSDDGLLGLATSS